MTNPSTASPALGPIGVAEATVPIGEIDLTTLRAGDGKPILVLHDELGFPGWMEWTRALVAGGHELIVPLQPGFGQTPRAEWMRDFRDVASFYLRLVRELDHGPLDVVGFSAGGFIAAEMAVACPELVDRLVLVAPLGLKPASGEVFDFLAVTARAHVAATIGDAGIPEAAQIYGGEMTSERFELFEAARAETSRLGWEPFMYSDSLPGRLGGVVGVPTLIVQGGADAIVPSEVAEQYAAAIPGARLELMPGSGHRPEIEDSARFVELLGGFLTVGTEA